jgi:hypothetical protein
LVEQFVTQPLGERAVAIGHHHRAEPGIADVGMWKAGEQARRQCAFRIHCRAACLQFPVRVVVRALPHDMRQHRDIAPGHHRPDLAAHRREQDLAGALGGVVGVDMRVGAIAGHHRRVVDDRVVEVGVHVERHRDRRRRVDRADAAQQFPLTVFQALGDHRAVQIEHDAVIAAGLAPLGDRLADHAGHVLEGRVIDRPRGRRAGGDG